MTTKAVTETHMLWQIGEWFRRFSAILVGVGLLVALFTEIFADAPIGRGGRPKPPIETQRLRYLLVIGAGVPGSVWWAVRSALGGRGEDSRP